MWAWPEEPDLASYPAAEGRRAPVPRTHGGVRHVRLHVRQFHVASHALEPVQHWTRVMWPRLEAEASEVSGDDKYLLEIKSQMKYNWQMC